MARNAEFERKKAAALAALEQSKIWKSNYLPPMTRLAWRLGWQVRPPHFIAPWLSFAGLATYFFGAMLAGMALLSLILPSGATFSALLLPCLLGGLCFGLCMALYYIYSAKKNRLPRWVDL